LLEERLRETEEDEREEIPKSDPPGRRPSPSEWEELELLPEYPKPVRLDLLLLEYPSQEPEELDLLLLEYPSQ
jgi:hypothetical protein